MDFSITKGELTHCRHVGSSLGITTCCVICTDGDGCVRSVDTFISDESANLFIVEDSCKIYESLLDVDDSSIEVRPGYARVFGEGVLEWKRYSLVAHI